MNEIYDMRLHCDMKQYLPEKGGGRVALTECQVWVGSNEPFLYPCKTLLIQ